MWGSLGIVLTIFVLALNGAEKPSKIPQCTTVGCVKSCVETISNCTTLCKRQKHMQDIGNWTEINSCYDAETTHLYKCLSERNKNYSESKPCWKSDSKTFGKKSGEFKNQPKQKDPAYNRIVTCYRDCMKRNSFNCRKSCPKSALQNNFSSGSSNSTWRKTREICQNESVAMLKPCLSNALGIKIPK